MSVKSRIWNYKYFSDLKTLRYTVYCASWNSLKLLWYYLQNLLPRFTKSEQAPSMDPQLTKSQQKTICSQLGRVKLQLLYKANTHGFTRAAFHQRCDNHSPTVSVDYDASGFVFGGYTKQPFSQSGQYVNDDQAFLFTFSGEKLLKYPVTVPANAVRMIGNSGPCFGMHWFLSMEASL